MQRNEVSLFEFYQQSSTVISITASKEVLRDQWINWLDENNPYYKRADFNERENIHPIKWINSLPPPDEKEVEIFFTLLAEDVDFAAAMVQALDREDACIQWFAPSNVNSKELCPPEEEREKFRALGPTTSIKELLAARFRLMLWFYGYDASALAEVPAQQNVQVTHEVLTNLITTRKGKNFSARHDIWPARLNGRHFSHWTRLIDSAFYVGEPQWAISLFTCAMHTAVNDMQIYPHARKSLPHWVDCLRANLSPNVELPFYQALVKKDQGTKNVPLLSCAAFCDFINYRNKLKDELASIKKSCWAGFFKTSLQRKPVKINFLDELIIHLPHANNRVEIRAIVKKALTNRLPEALAGCRSNVKKYLLHAFPWLDLEAMVRELQPAANVPQNGT